MSLSKPYLLIVILLLTTATASAQTPTPPLTTQTDGVRVPQLQASAVVVDGTRPVVVVDDSQAAVAVTAPEPPVVATPIQNEAPLPAITRNSVRAQPSNPPRRTSGLGSATRNLLRQQVDGDQAGNALPVLGSSATLAHQRYLDSFKHPIPERFESSVTSKTSGSN